MIIIANYSNITTTNDNYILIITSDLKWLG